MLPSATVGKDMLHEAKRIQAAAKESLVEEPLGSIEQSMHSDSYGVSTPYPTYNHNTMDRHVAATNSQLGYQDAIVRGRWRKMPHERAEKMTISLMDAMLKNVACPVGDCVSPNDYAIRLFHVLRHQFDLAAPLSTASSSVVGRGLAPSDKTTRILRLVEEDNSAAAAELKRLKDSNQQLIDEISKLKAESKREVQPAQYEPLLRQLANLKEVANGCRNAVKYGVLEIQEILQRSMSEFHAMPIVKEVGVGSASGGMSLARQRSIAASVHAQRQANPFKEGTAVHRVLCKLLLDDVVTAFEVAPFELPSNVEIVEGGTWAKMMHEYNGPEEVFVKAMRWISDLLVEKGDTLKGKQKALDELSAELEKLKTTLEVQPARGRSPPSDPASPAPSAKKSQPKAAPTKAPPKTKPMKSSPAAPEKKPKPVKARLESENKKPPPKVGPPEGLVREFAHWSKEMGQRYPELESVFHNLLEIYRGESNTLPDIPPQPSFEQPSQIEIQEIENLRDGDDFGASAAENRSEGVNGSETPADRRDSALSSSDPPPPNAESPRHSEPKQLATSVPASATPATDRQTPTPPPAGEEPNLDDGNESGKSQEQPPEVLPATNQCPSLPLAEMASVQDRLAKAQTKEMKEAGMLEDHRSEVDDEATKALRASLLHVVN